MTAAAPEQQTNPFTEAIAEIVAASRYTRWDAHHVAGMSWRDYVEADPNVAEGIYRADGRADAQALLPLLTVCLNKARSETARAAAVLVTELDPDTAAQLLQWSTELDPIQNGQYDALFPDHTDGTPQ